MNPIMLHNIINMRAVFYAVHTIQQQKGMNDWYKQQYR